MHMLIRALVYANSKDEALSEARDVFDQLTDHGPFDYYTMFDTTGTAVSGRSRWGPWMKEEYGEIVDAARADSDVGEHLIEQAWQYTAEEFEDSIEAVREALDTFSNEEIREEEGDAFLVRYKFYKIGMHRGSAIYLYDHDAEGIRRREQLDNVLNKWESTYADKDKPNPYADKDVWVVPADVHH